MTDLGFVFLGTLHALSLAAASFPGAVLAPAASLSVSGPVPGAVQAPVTPDPAPFPGVVQAPVTSFAAAFPSALLAPVTPDSAAFPGAVLVHSASSASVSV